MNAGKPRASRALVLLAVLAASATLAQETPTWETSLAEALTNETLTNEKLTNETLGNETLANETLTQAWDAALLGNHDILAAAEAIGAAREQVAAAEALRLPQVTLKSGYTRFDAEPTIESETQLNIDSSTQTVPFEYRIGERNSLHYGAMVSLPLYNGGQTQAVIEAARARALAATSDRATQEANTRIAVAEAYFNVLRAQRGQGVARAHVASLERHQADIARIHGQGLVPRSDLLAAEVTLADARQQLLQVENQLRLAEAGYNQLLARPLEQPVRPAEAAVEPVMPGAVDDWVQRALHQRPELAALGQQIDSAGAQVRGAAGSRLPKVGLSTGYLYQDNGSLEQPGIFTTSVDLAWSLYDGGGAEHLRRSLAHRQAELLRRRDGLRELIGLQVRRYWLMQQETRQRLTVTRGAIAQAEENLTATRNGYREGLARNAEVLDAEALQLKTRTNHTNATYDAALATLQLRWAAGEL